MMKFNCRYRTFWSRFEPQRRRANRVTSPKPLWSVSTPTTTTSRRSRRRATTSTPWRPRSIYRPFRRGPLKITALSNRKFDSLLSIISRSSNPSIISNYETSYSFIPFSSLFIHCLLNVDFDCLDEQDFSDSHRRFQRIRGGERWWLWSPQRRQLCHLQQRS